MVGRRGNGGEELHVNVPSFFRCPISLDVMRSPVSLCTGVTYDRSSIQTWLDTGHNTCPATMQVLPTTDFVPNHTLHRLIQLWSAQSLHQQRQQLTPPINADALVRGLPSSADPLPSLRKLAEVAGDPSRVRELVENAASLPALHGVLLRKGVELEVMEAAVRVLSPVLRHRKEGVIQIDASAADLRVLPSLVAILRRGTLDSRIAAAWLVEAMAAAGVEAKHQIAEAEGMLAELLRLAADEEGVKPVEPRAIVAGLAALAAVSSARRVRPRIVALGPVPALGRLLARPSTPAAAVDSALRLMEAVSTSTEGRAAICADPAAVRAVVGRMTRVPAEAAELAVAVLWTVCHHFRDRRAQEAAAAGGGLAKVLLLMQSNCSPAARQMGGDLLKILRASTKGGGDPIPSYDSKTTHITPF